MKKLLMGAIAASGLVLGTACSDTFNPAGDQQGRLLPSIYLDSEVAAPNKVASQAKSRATGTARSVSVDDLKLKLTSADGLLQRIWASLSNFDASEFFPVGNYTLEASYGDADDEGFDKPYYYGTTSVRIYENEASPVSLTAALGNAMITVTYTDAVKQYFSSFEGKIVTSTGASISYLGSETRAAYVHPGHVEVTMDVTKQSGVSATLSVMNFTAAARHHYYVTVDVNGGNVNNANLSVTFNSDLEEETVELDLSDSILSLPAPTITATGFASGEAQSFVAGTTPTNKLRMVAMSAAGLNSCVLSTNSTSLIEQGWPATIDFSTADAATIATMQSLGLEMAGVTGTMSQMAMLDFTKVISHIAVVSGDSNNSTFTLLAKDKYSKISDTTTLSVNIEPLQISIDNIIPLLVDVTELTVEFSYNGANANSEVAFETRNDRGTWEALTVNSVTAGDGANSYVASITPPTSDSFYIRARVGSTTTDAQLVTRIGHRVAVNDVDVFATAATGTLSLAREGSAADALAASQIYLSTDNKNFSVATPTISGAEFTLNNLAANTTYYVKALYDEAFSTVVSFHTETATQLTNSDMETWAKTTSGSYYECWDVTGWATYNPMTTASGANLAYVKRSGTAQSTDKHGGTYAAELRTIGWGSGNSAWGTISSSNPKYITKGMLYLGTSPTDYDKLSSQVTQGITFASRPSSISFWYKYSKKNSADYGGMTVWVKDAAGNVIASGSQSGLNATAYTQVTVPLTYAAHAAKAASIFVEFASSDNPNYATRSTDWFTVPSFGNLSDGKFQGSSMFIDDIALNY